MIQPKPQKSKFPSSPRVSLVASRNVASLNLRFVEFRATSTHWRTYRAGVRRARYVMQRGNRRPKLGPFCPLCSHSLQTESLWRVGGVLATESGLGVPVARVRPEVNLTVEVWRIATKAWGRCCWSDISLSFQVMGYRVSEVAGLYSVWRAEALLRAS